MNEQIKASDVIDMIERMEKSPDVSYPRKHCQVFDASGRELSAEEVDELIDGILSGKLKVGTPKGEI